MHRRFKGARAVTLTAPGGTIRAFVAEGIRLRLLGLMRLPADAIEPALFPSCRSVHTLWMRAPIDIVWLDLDEVGESARVIAVAADMAPRRRAGAPRGVAPRKRIAALELEAGGIAALDLSPGNALSVRFEHGDSSRSAP